MGKLVFPTSLLLLFLVGVTSAAYCHGKPEPRTVGNNNPIQAEPPKFVRSVENGKLYTVGEGDETIQVVHLWGTPTEMGQAHGQLVKERAKNMIDRMWEYLEKQVTDAINGTLPDVFHQWFLDDVANVGLEVALDLEVLATEKYSGGYFLEEIQGMASAAGIDFKKVLRIHMIGELTKGSCSMFGAWGEALFPYGTMLPATKLLQMRALDWITDGPLQDFPQITVYHPDGDENGHAFANVGWTGWLGSITGMSEKQMAISEIGVSYPDDSFEAESRFGVPFTYLLRDILQFDETLDDSINRIANSARTCDLIFGVGDGKLNEFRGVQYSASVANFFDDQNLKPTADWHPLIKDVVYWGMDWLCPGYSEVLAKQLRTLHGNLTAQSAIRAVMPYVQTGSLHIAVYDLTNDLMFVANARGTGESGPDGAYDRPFVRLDMKSLFAEQKPS
ncbi:protein dcd1A-like [Branchiostoma lanceolatum]|uniref:protein dcd1A-like n=1 Tax=Branchiostoma lanceolatum TaxID=7740 RepID=UPI003451F620